MSNSPRSDKFGDRPNQALPTLAAAKTQAKLLRTALENKGQIISHSQALELLAKQNGFNDWNTMVAKIGNQPPQGWQIGQRVSGQYLSQNFQATIVAMRAAQPGWFHLELELDEAVDVVTFDSFSNYRKRVRTLVGPQGTSREKTSNGVPHMQIEM